MNNLIVESLQALLFSRNLIYNCEGMEVTFQFNPGAAQSDLQNLPQKILSLLPNDYKEILGYFNGFTIYNYENIAGFEFLGTENIVAENEIQMDVFEDEWDKNIILFCKVLGAGDFIGFKTLGDRYEILDCCHDDFPKDWIVISNSFDEFLKKLIEAQGNSYWLNKL